MKLIVYGLLIFALLSGCGSTTVETGPSVNLGIASVSLHVNSQGQFVVNGQVSVPILLGVIDWDVAFNSVSNDASNKANYLILLWQDTSNNVMENDYSIGQPFQIDFEHDEWVRRISHQPNGAIIVYVDKQAIPTDQGNQSPPQSGTNNNSSNPYEQHYSDPGDFARWYFTAVWKDRDYDYLWSLSTPSFHTSASPGGYNEFITWWGSVDSVDIGSVSVLNNDGQHATIEVIVTFNLHNGQVLSNETYDYDLTYDSGRQTWMFDYR